MTWNLAFFEIIFVADFKQNLTWIFGVFWPILTFQVVCAKCSGQKQILTFEDKACRVCKSCHEVIKSRLESEKSEEMPEKSENHSHQLISKDTLDVQVRPKGLLEVRFY